jgi:hypothetical protein
MLIGGGVGSAVGMGASIGIMGGKTIYFYLRIVFKVFNV